MDFLTAVLVAIPAIIIAFLVIRGLVAVALIAASFVFSIGFWTVKAIRGHSDLY